MPPLDCPVYYPSPVYGDLGDGEKILNTTSARPGLSWGGFSFALVPSIPSGNFPPLVRPPMASRRHLRPCSAERNKPQKQNRHKGHLQTLHGVFSSSSVPIFPCYKTPHRDPHRATQGANQPRPTPPGASRGVVICSGPGRGRRSAPPSHPTRRSGGRHTARRYTPRGASLHRPDT